MNLSAELPGVLVSQGRVSVSEADCSAASVSSHQCQSQDSGTKSSRRAMVMRPKILPAVILPNIELNVNAFVVALRGRALTFQLAWGPCGLKPYLIRRSVLWLHRKPATIAHRGACGSLNTVILIHQERQYLRRNAEVHVRF